jgi:hypothetical protein
MNKVPGEIRDYLLIIRKDIKNYLASTKLDYDFNKILRSTNENIKTKEEEFKLNNDFFHMRTFFYEQYSQIDEEAKEAFDRIMFLLNIQNGIHDISNYSIEQLALILLVHSYLLIFYCKNNMKRFTFNIRELDKEMTMFKKYIAIDQYDFYYRGQSDCSWGLSPNLYRVLNKEHISKSDVDDFYFKSGLRDKYDKVFPLKAEQEYDRIAFFQHSCSCSPFIDFTKSLNIAEVFASSPFSNSEKDGAVYVLACLKKSVLTNYQNPQTIQSDSKQFSFDLLDVSYLSKINYDNKSFLGISNSELFFDDLKISIKIYDKETNDRMKYQQGVFLYLEKGTILGDIFLYPFLDQNAVLFKFIIPKEYKKEIINESYKNVKYSYDMLMDPYHYFETNN